MWRRVLPASVAAFLAGLLLAGCGSDDDGSPSGSDVPEGWTVVTDESSGIAVAMPEEVQPQEQDSATSDGGTMKVRVYATVVDSEIEIGFNVLDLDGGTYDLDAGLEGVVSQIGGNVENSESITVDGNEAIEAEASYGPDHVTTFQLIHVDDYVLQPFVSSVQDSQDQADKYFEQLTGSIDLG